MRREVSLFAGVLAALCAAVAAPLGAAGEYSLLGQSAPDFALRASAGPNVRLSEYRGEVVAVSFWSSRCGACSTQLASLQRSLATFGAAGLRVLGVSVDDDAERALQFARAQAVQFPMLVDPTKEVGRLYRVDNLPMTVLIDRSGSVRHMHRDFSGKSDALYLRELRALLNE